MKRTTIVDVARRAGTSTAVVSYVLNPGSKPVSDGLRVRVLQAVAELDYRPHRHARDLRRRSDWGQLGVLIPDLTLPFYATLAASIEAEARRRRQLVLTGNTGFEVGVERELARSFVDAGVDSLLVAGVCDGRAVAQLCRDGRVPLIWVHHNRNADGPHAVCSDHVRAGVLAAQHLIDTHRRASIAFVGGFTDEHVLHGDRDTVRERFEGYREVVGAAVRHIATDLTLDSAYRAVRGDIRANGAPDGLIVGTFFQAAPVLRALADAGLRVPADVPVVGFDADARNKYGLITLTAVQQDVDELARRAISSAGSPQHSPAPATTSPRVPVRLVPAESCGCVTQFGGRIH
ncbi:LacI family DNA-binding transcriptional regulator [[Mycobacterium] wendilense]|uniref:LacI family DNA-binding transcriptional regulator n=1 Tax=[Mycobacterium] wendilense TaxID=3064284 RepID=A0ABN9P4E6_9MYCO|nr:LacI family DNA-binding transcriptional regulator [Mycolicibacterium sp. MU0050]CAJ1586820.1 LacI family DNA-binding transcriptional regulator [Mycolicibacterium sp. MU0050]